MSLFFQKCRRLARLCQQHAMDRLTSDHQPAILRPRNHIAPFSISSVFFTLICSEILLTDTHCECFPPARSYTPLHKRRARGWY